MSLEIERRTGRPELVEFRAAMNDDGLTLSGYAIVFNSLSQEMFKEGKGRYCERILPGAMTRSLSSDYDVFALLHHDEKEPIACRSNGRLTIGEDAKGHPVTIRPNPATTRGRDCHEDVKDKLLRSMSFGMTCLQDRWFVEDGKLIREVIEAVLHEVSVVTWPAYDAATIEARKAQLALETRSEPEEQLAEIVEAPAPVEEAPIVEDDYYQRLQMTVELMGVVEGGVFRPETAAVNESVEKFGNDYYEKLQYTAEQFYPL